jgi:hypothetical protein
MGMQILQEQKSARSARLETKSSGSPSTPEIKMLLDDIQVSISVARRQEHEALQKSARDGWLETKTQRPLQLKRPFKHLPIEPQEQSGFQKILLAESAESTRLKAKLSGLWNQDFPLTSNAQSH